MGGLRGRKYLLTRGAAAKSAAKSRYLRLPLIAERQDQHLLVDVGVFGQRFHRAATRGREHFVCRLGLPIESRQRRNLRRLLAMDLQPEPPLETLIILGSDIHGV